MGIKIMEMLWERIIANSIPVSIAMLLIWLYIKYSIYPFVKKLLNRLAIIEDKQEASILTLHNGKYAVFEKEYKRLSEERDRINKLNNDI